MCKVVVMNVDNRKIRVADIKKKYMNNIIDAAKKCDLIDKVILFGSSIEDRCKESSDIDIAVFGNQIRSKALSSKKYERFARQLFAYNDFEQDYDILYFKSGTPIKSLIMDDIQKGEVLYERT